jgi:hypothetical protein
MSERFTWNALGDLTKDDIAHAQERMPKADREDMEMKYTELKNKIKFRDFTDELMFERAFKMGYVATFVKAEI